MSGVKLTGGMRIALKLMAEKGRPVSFYEAKDAGSSGIALSRLCDLGLSFSEGVKHGQVWHITNFGRLALSQGGGE